MIPQNFKDILANTDYAGFYQTLSMIIFLLFFVILILYVFTRPKKFYHEAERAPLRDDQ
ncbi:MULTISPECIES: cbb3-type cytochrome c oxidase subunit 3 [Chryseobacterium]|uniref:Cbb3-type cytochrome oxidase component FixQ n=1 Tax=Chryseobacterium wanjuense TaxID=356305 RepID=A0A1I0RZQ5_9FLAO|nr:MULTISPECIES: cbb3-type cytochrome c oxidase subunit 3 [Chryseobacterium]SEW47062.1 Cbb3-type cytochrome oxidase component FixQ [Chryseobacterium wanjuense]